MDISVINFLPFGVIVNVFPGILKWHNEVMCQGYFLIVIFFFHMLSNLFRFTDILKGSFKKYASIPIFFIEQDKNLTYTSLLKFPGLLNSNDFFLHPAIFRNL